MIWHVVISLFHICVRLMIEKLDLSCASSIPFGRFCLIVIAKDRQDVLAHGSERMITLYFGAERSKLIGAADALG